MAQHSPTEPPASAAAAVVNAIDDVEQALGAYAALQEAVAADAPQGGYLRHLKAADLGVLLKAADCLVRVRVDRARTAARAMHRLLAPPA